MKTVLRILIVIIVFLACLYFIYWTFPLLMPSATGKNIPLIIALLISTIICVFLFKKTGKSSKGMISYILISGIIVGAISFILGFMGPLILTPQANQGPLLGFFIAPIGFIIGLIGGTVSWYLKKRRMNNIQKMKSI